MDFKLFAEQEQERFRGELRGWLEANSPGDWRKLRAGLTKNILAERVLGLPKD